jgi:hypothetical protein
MRRIIIEYFPLISLICSIIGWGFLMLLFSHAIDHRFGCSCCIISFTLGLVLLAIYWNQRIINE